MKNKYLASTAITALVSLGTAAAAEITISGSARIGITTTEGAAAITADTTYTAIASDSAFIEALSTTLIYNAGSGQVSGVAVTIAGSTITAVTAGNVAAIDALRVRVADIAANGATSLLRSNAVVDLTSIDGIIARLDATVTTAVAKQSDTTVGKNRVRISFAASGETDGGLTYGMSARADQSNTSTGGTQYISGAFGKITMGDLDGADEQTVGNLAGVGFSGAGSKQEFAYQSTDHNLGYSVSLSGVTFAATTDLVRGADTSKTGSNSAIGLKWSGDMGGATLGVAIGSSKIGTKTEDSASLSVAMGGLTIKAVSHTNDNGPRVASTAVSASTATGTAHVGAVADDETVDTDTTGLSVTYAMDAMSVTAFTRTESTSGVADKDYSGVGFTYNLGGATVKAGFVDAEDISIMDFGVNFSF